jgi:hypothetical protein
MPLVDPSESHDAPDVESLKLTVPLLVTDRVWEDGKVEPFWKLKASDLGLTTSPEFESSSAHARLVRKRGPIKETSNGIVSNITAVTYFSFLFFFTLVPPMWIHTARHRWASVNSEWVACTHG